MNRRLTQWIGSIAFGALAFGSQACVIRESPGVNRGYGYGYASAGVQGGVMVGTPSPYYVNSMPPEPLYETMTSSPGYGYVWIDGYWHWNGYEWVWMSGRWVTEQTGYVYIQPYYDYDSGGSYVYYPGHWSRPDHIDSRVKVRDHRDGRPTTGYYPQRERPQTRDHRDDGGGYVPPPSSGGRDHRDNTGGGTGGGTTTGRDHRDNTGGGGGTTTGRDHRDQVDVPPPPPKDDTSDHRTRQPPDTNVPRDTPPKRDTTPHPRGGNDHRSGGSGGSTKPAPVRPKTNVNHEAPRKAPQESPKRTAPKSNDHRRGHSMLEGERQQGITGVRVAMLAGTQPSRLLGQKK